MTSKPKKEHQFTSSWRWPDAFESWGKSMTSGFTVNVCAGLSTLGNVRIDLMSPPEIIDCSKTTTKHRCPMLARFAQTCLTGSTSGGM